MVAALFSKAGSDGSALLLHNGALIGNGLCGANIANELLDWRIGAVRGARYGMAAMERLTGAHPDGPADPRMEVMWLTVSSRPETA